MLRDVYAEGYGHHGQLGPCTLYHCMLFCPQVVATDSVSNNYSVATVTIHLRNINDHRPVFSQSLYELTVPEHSKTGYLVTDKIHVSDVGWITLGESC